MSGGALGRLVGVTEQTIYTVADALSPLCSVVGNRYSVAGMTNSVVGSRQLGELSTEYRELSTEYRSPTLTLRFIDQNL